MNPYYLQIRSNEYSLFQLLKNDIALSHMLIDIINNNNVIQQNNEDVPLPNVPEKNE